MDDKKPTITAWNADTDNINNSPVMQKATTVTDWSAVGNSMASDARKNVMFRWYVNTPLIFATFMIGRFVSTLLGLIMLAVGLTSIVIALARSPKSPHKNSQIIGWIIFYVIIGVLIII